MFRRKLGALDYHNPDGFDCTGKNKLMKEQFGWSVELNVEPANVSCPYGDRELPDVEHVCSV